MRLEDYFDIVGDPPESIRLKGTRVDIEFVLDLHKLGVPPERIVERYPALTLAQAYAAIAYYLTNLSATDAYLRRRAAMARANLERAKRQPPSAASQRLRELQAGGWVPGGEVAAS